MVLRSATPAARHEYDRVAVVTGADSGIGAATAVALARSGFDVGITYHEDQAGAQGTADEVKSVGRQAGVRRHDLRRLPEAADAIEELAEELGGLGVLVNNAGAGSGRPLLDTSYEQWRETLAVDLDGQFLCAQRAARRMVEAGRGGRIINVTSVHEAYPRVGQGAYCAAKGGLALLTRCLALELGDHDITVNAVAPGEIATPMTGQHDEIPQPDSRLGFPIARPGDAREVAAVIAFLASPAASYVTGATWYVDGGLSLMGPQAASLVDSNSWRS